MSSEADILRDYKVRLADVYHGLRRFDKKFESNKALAHLLTARVHIKSVQGYIDTAIEEFENESKENEY